jgi:hypothetical protein
VAASVAVTVVAGAALAGLVAGAVHGVRSTTALASSAQVASATEDDAYYACLTTQAHHLVRPGQVVDIDRDDLTSWATLGKVVAPWAVVTTDAHRAVAVLSLRTATGGASCLGVVVVARYADGQVRTGRGATLPGRGPPPATPL